MCRRHSRIKKSKRVLGQVILELVIVFICLSLLAIALTQVFANLNLNMVNRLQAYRDSRLAAVNNPARLAGINVPTPLNPNAPLSNPLTFLDYFPQSSITIPQDPASTGADWLFYQDSRMNEAALFLEEQRLSSDLIIPYKINQAKYLAELINWNEATQQWEPAVYIDLVKSLMGESIDLINRSYNTNFLGVIGLYRDILDDPTIPGSFDPDVIANAQLYGLDPNNIDTARIEKLQEQHTESRADLEGTISSLASAREGLNNLSSFLIYGRIPGVDAGVNSQFLGLEYVRTYIGDIAGHSGALNSLRSSVEGVGEISSPILNLDLAQGINQVHSLLGSAPTFDAVNSALTLSQEMLNFSQVQGSSVEDRTDLNDIVKELKDNLGLALRYWDEEQDRNYYLDLSRLESWALAEVAELQL